MAVTATMERIGTKGNTRIGNRAPAVARIPVKMVPRNVLPVKSRGRYCSHPY